MTQQQTFPHPYYSSLTKRVFDLMLALSLLTFCLPIFLLIGLAIFFEAGHPVIFIQMRLGKHKKPFQMYKFRTMILSAEKKRFQYLELNEAPFPMFKIANDPRFTKLGKWLSRSGLDELPQLINIIKGEMSFIGPRPLPIKEAKQLDDKWDFRYQVRPGILSEWVVDSKRYHSLISWIQLDKKTISSGSIFYEFQLCIRTLKMLIKTLF